MHDRRNGHCSAEIGSLPSFTITRSRVVTSDAAPPPPLLRGRSLDRSDDVISIRPRLILTVLFLLLRDDLRRRRSDVDVRRGRRAQRRRAGRGVRLHDSGAPGDLDAPRLDGAAPAAGMAVHVVAPHLWQSAHVKVHTSEAAGEDVTGFVSLVSTERIKITNASSPSRARAASRSRSRGSSCRPGRSIRTARPTPSGLGTSPGRADWRR